VTRRGCVVLVGPAAVGKSTIGPLLGTAVGRPFVDLDAVADRYYSEAGQSLDAFRAMIEAVGYDKAHRWWQPARVHALRRVLEDWPASIVAVGAGHSHFEDQPFADAATSILDGHTVVLLLPDPDAARSVALLRTRSVASKQHDWMVGGVDYLTCWVTGSQNRQLADHVIYLADRTPEAVAIDIVCTLKRPPGHQAP
jgi:hypothetical protein